MATEAFLDGGGAMGAMMRSHDFNNLLTVIRGSVDLLKRPGLSEERRVRYIDAISDTVTRAAKLTGQLLAFARRQALKPDVFDTGASVGAIAEMIGTQLGVRAAPQALFDGRVEQGAGGVGAQAGGVVTPLAE